MGNLFRFPLRVVIPLALVLFTCLISIFLAAYNFSQIDTQVEKEIRERVVQLMTRTQGTLRNLSRKGDDGGMRLEISQLGSDPQVMAAALVNDAGTILHATRYSAIGKHILDEVTQLSEDHFVDVRKRQVGNVVLDQEGRSYLAFYPVDLWSDGGALGHTAVGVLFLQYDLRAPQARAHRPLLLQIAQFSLVIGAFSVLLWLVFHFGLTRRVDRLVYSANRVGKGDIRVRAGLAGQDEIAQLGNAFDRMVDVIAEDRQRLADSERRMRAILDNAADCMVTTNDHGIIQTLNPALEHIFGYRTREVVGRHLGVLFTPPFQRLHDQYLSAQLQARGTRSHMSCEVTGRRRDGSEVDLEVAASDFELAGERLFLWILRDITERKKIERMKNEFVSVVSHELRTPLTSILGSLGLLNAGVLGELPEQAQKILGIAKSNSERLVRLINDILDIEKMESGELAFSALHVDLVELVQQAVEANRGYGDKYQVTLAIGPVPAHAYVEADPDRLMQVLTNLLSNAAKYSPAGGVVQINLTQEKSLLCVSIRDQGPGIPAAFRERIFDKFAQVDASDTRQKDGTGLGLSIARSIIELHGGQIGFRTPEGGGSEFWFELPVRVERPQRVRETVT